MEASSLFSVIIPTRNEGDLLALTVESILEQTRYPRFEIVVVDDGSTDGSCNPLPARDARIRVIAADGIGVACARNLGARHARGEYLAFLDAHCTVSPNWLDGFCRALAPPDVGVAGPAFTRLHQSTPRGCGMIWGDATLDPAWLEPRDTPDPYEVPLTTGACQAFRRTIFEAFGAFEQGFTRWGFEDVEICLRAWLLGLRVVVDPTVVVAHYFRESRNYEVDDVEITYNFLRMIHLHFSAPRIRRVLRAVGRNPFLTEALDRLYAGDVFHVRAAFDRIRMRDDDWFFRYVNRVADPI